jgi:hypothetical protein
MVVPSDADGLRAVVNALWSIDGKKVVSFHIYSFPEDYCVRFLVKNVGKRMPENFVREEQESLNISVMQLRSGCREQETLSTPSHTSLYCIGGSRA